MRKINRANQPTGAHEKGKGPGLEGEGQVLPGGGYGNRMRFSRGHKGDKKNSFQCLISA